MILLSNHLLTLDEFKNVDNVVVRINMAHVKDKKELKQFLNRDYDVFLDYPKGRTNDTPSGNISHIKFTSDTSSILDVAKYFTFLCVFIESIASVKDSVGTGGFVLPFG